MSSTILAMSSYLLMLVKVLTASSILDFLLKSIILSTSSPWKKEYCLNVGSISWLIIFCFSSAS